MFRTLDELHSIHRFTCVIEGEASGADQLAARWAGLRRVTIDPYPAKWREEGRGAGPIRNGRMLALGKPRLAVAFPGGDGTADMTKKVRRAGITLIEVDRWGGRWTDLQKPTGTASCKPNKPKSDTSFLELWDSPAKKT